MKLLQEDLLWLVRMIPSDIRKLLESHAGELFVAGGFIRDGIQRVKPSDIDLFATSAEQAKAWALDLAHQSKDLLITDNAVTILHRKLTPQFIHRWCFDTPADCIASFDFTIAAAALWHDGNEWTSVCDERFYPDLAAQRLVYRSPVRNEEAGGSMLRVLKFYQRGYRIPLDSLGLVIGRLLKGVEPINWEKRNTMDADQWAMQIGHLLTGLLHEVDPAIDPLHLAHLPETPASNKGIP